MLAKKQALDEAAETLNITQEQMASGGSDALPLDNLDENVLCKDALFSKWPPADAIVGNPPYQSKNKLQSEVDIGATSIAFARFIPRWTDARTIAFIGSEKHTTILSPASVPDSSAQTQYARITHARRASTTSLERWDNHRSRLKHGMVWRSGCSRFYLELDLRAAKKAKSASTFKRAKS